jgi:hypothetical protein
MAIDVTAEPGYSDTCHNRLVAWTTWAAPIATFVGGQISAFGLQWAQTRWQYRRDQHNREAARAEKFSDRRESFELESLKDLHLALIELGRATTTLLLSGHDGQDARSANLAYVQANGKANALGALLFDEGLRQLIDDAQTACALSFAYEGDPVERLKKPSDLLKRATDRIAVRIREIYVSEQH